MHETAARYYADKVRQFGASPRGVDWNSEASQVLRFEQLLRLIDGRELTSVNDYGCGYGALADHLHRAGCRCRYTGFDLAESMIAHARAMHEADPLCTFTSDLGAVETADCSFASGVFNVKQDHPSGEWHAYVLATLGVMDRLSATAFAFNMLSSYSDREKRRPDLFYGDPAVFFDYCKTRFSSRVALLHDYPLYEFTIVVRK